ncbi:MAG: hypothetical protein SFV18_00480 [Bryobacteraceae bacterium]|nr:hypothetical protein [Bryobacteraceae bacterium]
MRELLETMQAFLASAARPVLIEPGEPEMPLLPGQYSLESAGFGVRLHAWDSERSYSRRIVGLKSQRPGRIELRIAKLGRTEGTLTLFDSARAAMTELRRRGRREVFRERFRLALSRQFAGWRIEELSTAPDLEHSLSPIYPRARVSRGATSWAAIGAAPDSLDPDGVLSFGLIWLDYLRRRDPKRVVEGLAIFPPERHVSNTTLRLRWLDPRAANYEVFACLDDGGESRIDSRDWGNLRTTLESPRPARTLAEGPEAEMETLLRAEITKLDAALRPEFVYRQAPAIAGRDRGILDLLGVDRQGRLAVIELKASPDIHLPLQALDYWMRVVWHLDEGDFKKRGYFPGVELSSAPPLLYFVAPALEFHPSNDAVLRFFSPAIPMSRLGLGANWRENVKVVTRQDSYVR